jgi:hypothetical protein
MTRARGFHSPSGDTAPGPAGQSFGNVLDGRAFDPLRYRAVFPERWQAFLHAHFRSTLEVALFFDVTERAAGKWWNGTGGPQGDKVVLAMVEFPRGVQEFLMRAAA